MLKIEEINDAKYIVIVLEDDASIDHLASANALYTYLLQLHKKVSLYCCSYDYDLHLNFLPWIEKLKNSYPSSADYKINAIGSLDLLDFFIDEDIKLNKKMATSLYAGLLDVTKGFTSGIDGMIFAKAKLLVDSGADAILCSENLVHYQSYATLRLKAILLSKMYLTNDAKMAVFELEDKDLSQSGAQIKDLKKVLVEALSLPTVKSAVIMYKNEVIMKEEI